MISPYDWQEGIGHRGQYVESRLSGGSPVLAISIEEGIVLLTYRKQARKLFEIYDELAMGALGQQSDVEALRQAAVDFAHQEGFNRSEKDVTIHRVVNALSGPIKRAFADFSMVPVVARAIFAQVGPTPTRDAYAMLDFDGDFHSRTGYGYVAPSQSASDLLDIRLGELDRSKLTSDQAVAALKELWSEAYQTEEVASTEEITEGLGVEVFLLQRSPKSENRFRYLTDYQDSAV